jgi:hypothetical protein
MPMFASVISGCSRVWKPDIGTALIISMPPARITSFIPLRIACAPRAMVCRPLEQKRLTVIAETSTGNPARNAASRA